MSKPKQANKPGPKQLLSENKRLKGENLVLKKQLRANNHSQGISWRRPVVWLCAALAAVLLMVGNIFFWLGNTVVSTDKYSATASSVIKQPSVQTAIAGYTTKQLFNNYNVQAFVQDALPPRADFLAPQLTTQLQAGTQDVLQKILANPNFQQTWTTIQRKNHDRLINFAKNYQGNGQINMSDIYNQLAKNLKDTKLGFLADKPLPPKLGSIELVNAGWLPAVHNLVLHIGLYQSLATALLLALSGLAVWLADKRRRMVISLAILFSLTMLVSLIAIRITKVVAVSQISPDYQVAVRDTLNIIFQPLLVQTYTILAVSILAGAIAWLSGPYKSAMFFKSRVETLLAGRLHQSVFGNSENNLTRWVGRYKRQLQWGIVLAVAIVMLLVQLTPLVVLLYALLILLLVLIVELLAAKS